MSTLDDFLGPMAETESGPAGLPSDQGDPTLPDAAGEPAPAGPELEQGVTKMTPAGIEVYYQWAPKRLYRVRQPDLKFRTEGGEFESIHREWREVPSVTTILDCLDRSGALTWWGMRTGVAAALELFWRGELKLVDDFLVTPAFTKKDATFEAIAWPRPAGPLQEQITTVDGRDAVLDRVTNLVSARRMSTNHIKTESGDRGQSTHDALELWATQGLLPQPQVFPEKERGYVTGLRKFLEAIDGKVEDVQSEVTVGSIKNEFAGRYDIRFNLTESAEVCRKAYPKRKDLYGTLDPGRYLPDLKTSKYVMTKQFLQLEGYEGGSVECGYEPTDFRMVVHTFPDGRYECALSTDEEFLDEDGQAVSFQDFLDVKGAYHVTARKGWK